MHVDFSKKRRERLRRRQHDDVEALKALLTDEELGDLAGPGTRTFDDMPLRWAASDGVVHACEAAEIVPDTILVWTVCGRHDVPPLPPAALVDDVEMTCSECERVLLTANDHWPAELFRQRRPYAGVPSATPSPADERPTEPADDWQWWTPKT